MKIIINESQLINLLEVISNNQVTCDDCGWSWSLDDGGDDPYICHKCGHNNEVEPEPNSFSFTTWGEWFNSYNESIPKRAYFNGIIPLKYDSSIPSDKVKLTKINDSSETYLINKNEFKQNLNNKNELKTYVDLNYLNSISQNKTQSNFEIKSSIIKSALEQTFKNNWVNSDGVFSSGIRGVYKIGDYLSPKTSEDWSILNYFDTKKEVKKMIYDELLNRNLPLNDLVNSISTLFKDKSFMDTLVKRQWTSITDGELRERKFIKQISKILNSTNVTTYLPGSIMDRYNSVDVTIDDVNYQIKPLNKIYVNKDGDYEIKTYGMKSDYLKKPINKLVFCNDDEILIFNNKNYTVPAHYLAIFKEKPEIYKLKK
jgi:hypothetical protein